MKRPAARRHSLCGDAHIVLSLLCLASALVTPTWAQDDGDDPESTWEERIVVTASRLEEGESDVTASVTVLDADDLEAMPTLTADDFLRRVPGFSLFRRSSSLVAHPTTQGLSLRGIAPSGASRTLVLLDGVPLNDPFGGWIYWSRVPMERLQKVEIVRGGGSSLWGDAALGGVVQLVTRQPDGDQLAVRGELGSRGIGSLNASWDHRLGPGQLTLHGHDFEMDGFPVLAAPQRGAIDVDAFSEHSSFGVAWRQSLTAASQLRAAAEVFTEDRGNGTPLTGNDTDALSFSAVWNRTWGDSELELRGMAHDQGFASTFSAQEEDRSSESPALDQYDVDANAIGIGGQWSGRFGSTEREHAVVAGGELRAVDGQTNERYFFSDGDFLNQRQAGGEQLTAGLYAQDSLHLGNRWLLQAGLRVDRWETSDGLRLEQRRADGTVLRRETPPDRSETELSPRLSALLTVSPALQLVGSYYQGFRAPTINELFRPFRVRNDITEANALLDPERLQGLDLGLRAQGRRIRGRLTGFVNELDDPVINASIGLGPGQVAPCGFVPAGGSCRQRQNLDRSRVLGVEGELEVLFSEGWSLEFGLLENDTEIREASAQPELVGNEIPQVPELQLSAELRYSGSATGLWSLRGRWVDDQYDDDLNERVLQDFTLVDASWHKQLSESWGVFAVLENVFDREVPAALTADGLLTLGSPRLLHGGVRFQR